MDTIRAFFFQNRGTFLIFKKGQGRPPPTLTPSCAPGFILKMPNCATVGYTNRSTKNPNLSFHEYVMSGCKLLRGKNPFQKTYLLSKHFEKYCFERDLKANRIMIFVYDVGFWLKYLKKAREVVF